MYLPYLQCISPITPYISRYDAGTASVADLMVGWWDKVRSRWGWGGARAKTKAVARAEATAEAEARVLALPPEGGASQLEGAGGA